MNNLLAHIDNENGSILVLSMLILILLTLIGISAMNSSTVETQLSGNDKFYKMAFHEADAGTEAAISLIEENLSCPAGFADPPNASYHPSCTQATDPIMLGQVIVPDGNEAFYRNEATPPATYTRPGNINEDTNGNGILDPGEDLNGNGNLDGWDTRFYFPDDFTSPMPLDSDPQVNQTFNGNTRLSTGSGLQMAAGYEGKGKGTGAGGGEIVYDLPAQRVGRANCETCVRVQWRHRIGYEGDCSYF